MDDRSTVLVCVTAQQSSEKLIDAGREIADENAADLEVISVLPIEGFDSRNNPEILDRLHQYAKSAGGDMAVYFSDDPTLTVAAHMARTKPKLLVTGYPGEGSNGFISLIHLLLPEVPISMIDGDKVYNILPFESSQPVCKG